MSNSSSRIAPTSWQRSSAGTLDQPLDDNTRVDTVSEAPQALANIDRNEPLLSNQPDRSARTSVDSARTLKEIESGNVDEGTPALTPATSFSSAADDSDTDFQSAYSTSPRDSYMSMETGDFPDRNSDEDADDEEAPPQPRRVRSRMSDYATPHTRARVSSIATVTSSRRSYGKETISSRNKSIQKGRTPS